MKVYFLFVVSLASIGVLVGLRGEAERIVAVPDVEQLAEQVAFLGDVQAIEWLPEYSPMQEPRSGVVRSYQLRHGRRPTGWLFFGTTLRARCAGTCWLAQCLPRTAPLSGYLSSTHGKWTARQWTPRPCWRSYAGGRHSS